MIFLFLLCSTFLFQPNKVVKAAEVVGEENYKMSSGKNHTLLKSDSGDVFAWGTWGDVSITSPIASLSRVYPTNITSLFPLTDNDCILDVFSGEQHSFVITKQQRIFAFGFDGQGQLGDGGEVFQQGDLQYESQLKKTPVEITKQFTLESNDKIIKLCGGANFSLALSKNGEIFSFGENNHGQLGDSSIVAYQTSPINITALFHLEENEKMIDISCGAAHALALSNFGHVYSWGNNNFGQVGKEDTQISRLDFGSEKGIQIACGSFHSYVLTSLHHLYGFGFNGFGQLADKKVILNNGNDKKTPYEMTLNFSLSADEQIVSIFSGHYFGMAITSTHRVFSFGQNNNGQLGNGNNLSTSTPVDITEFIPLSSEDSILQIQMGEKHVIALSASCEIFAWGDNGQSQLGASVNINHSWKPYDITAKFPPIIRFSMLGSSNYSKSYTIEVESYYINNQAVEEIAYIFTRSDKIIPAENDKWQNIHNGDSVTLQDSDGTYYLWVKVLTVEEEEYYKVSQAFYIDSILPSLIVSRYNDETLKNHAIVSEAVYVKATDNLPNVQIMVRMNQENEFTILTQSEHIFISDGQYEVKAVDVASNVSDSFFFIIDTIAPFIKTIDLNVLQSLQYTTKRHKIKITASETIVGYIYQDNDYITALDKEKNVFEITLKKGKNTIVLVDLSGKKSETYTIYYQPTFFEDAEKMIFVFGLTATVIILVILGFYLIKSKKQFKFDIES